MDKDLRYIELFDIYKDLLTSHQQEMFSSHYYYDLSLSEIAEPVGNTRQNVYAALKKVKEKLDEYESKLGVFAKTQQLQAVAEKLQDKEPELSKEISDIIGK